VSQRGADRVGVESGAGESGDERADRGRFRRVESATAASDGRDRRVDLGRDRRFRMIGVRRRGGEHRIDRGVVETGSSESGAKIRGAAAFASPSSHAFGRDAVIVEQSLSSERVEHTGGDVFGSIGAGESGLQFRRQKIPSGQRIERLPMRCLELVVTGRVHAVLSAAEFVEKRREFGAGVRVSAAGRGLESGPHRGDRVLPSVEGFERPGAVVVDVPVVRICGRGSLVPADGRVVVTAVGMFLRDPVEAERILGIGFKQGEQSFESVGGGHAGIVDPEGTTCKVAAVRVDPVIPSSTMNRREAPFVPCSSRTAGIGAFALMSVLVGLAGPIGCETTYAPRQTLDLRPRVLDVLDHHGGTRRTTLVQDDVWYQSFGPEIEVVDARDGLRISTVEVGPWGEIPPISDMVIVGDELIAVHARDRVVRYAVDNPRRPRFVEEIDAATLGIDPLFASVEDDRVWISGDGGTTPLDAIGLVELGDLTSDAMVGHVVATSEGLAAPVGRRILALDDGRYLGAASDLRAIKGPVAQVIDPDGGFVFLFASDEATTVGVLGPDLRERDRRAFPTTIHVARVLGDRLWAVMPTEIVTWPIESGGLLGQPLFIPVKGARDIAMIRENYYAVAGTFGRAIYRFKADGSGDADEFFAVERSPGRLEMAITDGRRVLAGGVEGNWLYRIGGTIELSDRPLRSSTEQVSAVTLAWCEAAIEESGRELRISAVGADPVLWSPPRGGIIHTLEAAGDHVWVGHDDGIEAFGWRDGAVVSAGSIVMEGPVAWLFRPRVGDEVCFVSVFGGIGTAEIVPDPDADPGLVRMVRPEDADKAEREMREAAGLPPKPTTK
jgi:hypothetical protein